MTERQRQVARGVALGESVQDLARRLGVRPQHVRRLLTDLYVETGTRSQAGLVGWCAAHEIVTVPEFRRAYGQATVGRRTEW
jgi:DNA-binding CsgD family transcriptional regulator